MLYVGLISGTSADAIDTALVEITDQIHLLDTLAVPYPQRLQQSIRTAFQIPDISEELFRQLDREIGACFAEATLALLKKASLTAEQITALGSHGQTLRHEPNAEPPFSLQAGSGRIIADHTGVTTVCDFRRADLEAGGQGAPLAPALHKALFRHPKLDRGILNLGGIANITILPADPNQAIVGYDTGPANTLLDSWIRQHRSQPFDRDGEWAESGAVNEALLEQLLADPYFALPPPKSTGFEYFNLRWLEDKIKRIEGEIAAADVQATLLALTVRSVRDAVPNVQEVYICGGGVHNRYLMAQLAAGLEPISVGTSDLLGLDPDWVEATTFAWLAHRRLEGLPGNLPSVTGAREAVLLGDIYHPKK